MRQALATAAGIGMAAAGDQLPAGTKAALEDCGT